MPEVEVWTVNPFRPAEDGGRLKQLGINFGAAGTRRAEDGTVWLEYPPVASEEFPIGIEVDGDSPRYTRRHSTSQEGDLSWVKASCLTDFSSITIDGGKDQSDGRFDVRLFFAESVPSDAVLLQGNLAATVNERQLGFEDVEFADGKLRIDVQREDPDTQLRLSGIELKRK